MDIFDLLLAAKDLNNTQGTTPKTSVRDHKEIAESNTVEHDGKTYTITPVVQDVVKISNKDVDGGLAYLLTVTHDNDDSDLSDLGNTKKFVKDFLDRESLVASLLNTNKGAVHKVNSSDKVIDLIKHLRLVRSEGHRSVIVFPESLIPEVLVSTGSREFTTDSLIRMGKDAGMVITH